MPGAAGEAQIAEAVAAALRRIGLDVEMQDAAPGRPNVIGVLEGRRKGRSLMLCGHTDTVGVEGMTAPFDPPHVSGRLFGRGTQDMKSGVAAMIDAARRRGARRGWTPGRLIVAAGRGEEHESIGADALVTRWRADVAIVHRAHRSADGDRSQGLRVVRHCDAGRAAHGSRPDEGRDAIVRMGRVLHELEQLDDHSCSRVPPIHSWAPRPCTQASSRADGN